MILRRRRRIRALSQHQQRPPAGWSLVEPPAGWSLVKSRGFLRGSAAVPRRVPRRVMKHFAVDCVETRKERAARQEDGLSSSSIPDVWEMKAIFSPQETSWRDLRCVLRWVHKVDQKLIRRGLSSWLVSERPVLPRYLTVVGRPSVAVTHLSCCSRLQQLKMGFE